jgi:hypothetical protein
MDDELSFYVEKNGENIKCDILALIPGDNDFETYVAFTDFIEQENGNNYMQYAKIVNHGDSYSIEEFEDEEIVNQLKNIMAEKIFASLEEQAGMKYE